MTQRPIFELGISDKSITSMFPIELIEQNQLLPCLSLMKSSTKTQIPTVWILFLWARVVSGPCHGSHDRGEAMVVPIWLHNELEARHRVTNRYMSYGTYSTVGSKQTVRLLSIKNPAISFWVSHFIILFLTHCHSALWFVLLQNCSNCATCLSRPTFWRGVLWSWTTYVQRFIDIHVGRACKSGLISLEGLFHY